MFSDQFNPTDVHSLVTRFEDVTSAHVRQVLKKSVFSISDLPILLSDAAHEYLETIAQRSHAITVQRFGKAIQLFAPVYISNLCSNKCTYCGFSVDKKVPRKVLTEAEIHAEATILKKFGFGQVLVLTGESDRVGVNKIAKSLHIFKNYFPSIGIEVQPFDTPEYRELISSGAQHLTLFQETYHEETYSNVHLIGQKMDFKYRLNAVDRACNADFQSVTLGALLGLADWRFDLIALAMHLEYLQKKYWKTQYLVSFPRINTEGIDFKINHNISDRLLVQIITVFRLLFPDLGIVLSTREHPSFRDKLIPLGITTMSAASKTSPGGYSGQDYAAQFEIHDNRSLEQIKQLLISKSYEPLIKNWDHQFL